MSTRYSEVPIHYPMGMETRFRTKLYVPNKQQLRLTEFQKHTCIYMTQYTCFLACMHRSEF